MNERLAKYLDEVFSPYEDIAATKELKEELLSNLQEKFDDLKSQDHDDETAYRITVESIGDISEIVESISVKNQELKETAQKDLSAINLRDSDLTGIRVHEGQFNASDLRDSDFSGSDLTGSSFNASDLRQTKFTNANLTSARFTACDLRKAVFDGANLTRARIFMADLTKASFKNTVMDAVDMGYADLSGAILDDLTIIGASFNGSALKETSFRNVIFKDVSFKDAYVKKAVFDGATMDKITYAILKGSKANLTNVKVI
jgi:BTB/POZ domain-containing protein KCTD9